MSTSIMPRSEAASLGPLADWCDLDSGTHVVQFYAQDAALLDALSRFIGGALVAGDGAVVIATEAHRRGLEDRLRERGLDVNMARRSGRYAPLDATATLARFMENEAPDPGRFAGYLGAVITRVRAAAEGAQPRVAAFGEMVALLWAVGQCDAAIRVEQLWNELSKTNPINLRCAYPLSSFNREPHGEPLRRICGEHSGVVPAETYTSLESEQERLRNIIVLQQKAEALQTEIAERQRAENSLQRREAELAECLENAVEGVQQVGPDQTILWANRALLKLLGYREDQYVGHWLAKFHVQPEVFDEFWHKLMRREDIYDFPAELRCKDGSVRHVLIHSNGLWENGRFMHTRCFLRDVTEHKRMQQALWRTEKLAATARLAASIAHEINNPLESLTNLLYLLQSCPLDETARSYAAMAEKELQRTAHITKQMLAFYREPTRPVRFKLSEILDSVVELYAPKLESRNLTVERDYAVEGVLQGLPSEMRQLFANLLGNAIEAACNGTIRLQIRESRDWSNGHRPGIRISIADSGCGIAPEARKLVFEPFFTTKGESGTGLGLWVSRGIVQKHQGSIRFRSSVRPGGSGTVFSVFLPANTGQAALSIAG